jgi:hypothetical protein
MEDKAMMITGFVMTFSLLADENFPMGFLPEDIRSETRARMFAIAKVFSHVEYIVNTINSIIESGESNYFTEIMLMTLNRTMKHFSPEK